MNSNAPNPQAVEIIDEYTVSGPAVRFRLRAGRSVVHVLRDSNWPSSREPVGWVRRAWHQQALCGAMSATVVAGEIGDVATWPAQPEPVDQEKITCSRCASRYPRARGVA